MKLNSLPRRQLIKSTGITLGALAAGHSWANNSTNEPEPRVIFVYVPSGALEDYWHPQGCGSQFALNEMSAPFETVKEHCTFLQGFSAVDYGHGNVWRLLNPGVTYSESLDVRLAKHFSSASVLPLAAVDNSLDSMTVESDALIASISDMQKAFNYLFAEQQLDSALFNHFSTSEIADESASFELRSKQMMELAVLALQHDKTRVASLLLGDDQGTFRLPGLGLDYEYAQAIHAMPKPEAFIAYRRFLSSRVAYLIQLLAATKDNTGTPLIDSTLVVQVTDMANGDRHDSANAPLMLAGGNRYIKNGIAYQAQSGALTNRELLDTVCAAVGFNDGDTYGAGAISDLLI